MKKILFKATLASENITKQDLYDIAREVECAWEQMHGGEKLKCIIVLDRGNMSMDELLKLCRDETEL